MNATLESIRNSWPKELFMNQFGPFCAALDRGDKLTAWRILLPSRRRLTESGVAIPENIEELAQGIGLLYHNNGKLCSRLQIKDEKLHGILQVWDENGKLKTLARYDKDKLSGIYKEYYNNGSIKLKVYYKNGEVAGAVFN